MGPRPKFRELGEFEVSVSRPLFVGANILRSGSNYVTCPGLVVDFFCIDDTAWMFVRSSRVLISCNVPG